MGAVTGVIWGLLVTRLRIPPFILTLGGLSIFRSLALQRADDVPVPVRGRFGWLGSYEVFGLVRTPVALALAVLVVSALVLRYTRFGRHVYAAGSSEDASYLAGLPTNRTKVMVFVISSTLAAAAGLVLMARIGAGDPRAAPGYELQAIAAVVLGGASLAGGRGSAVGTYLGVVLLGVVSASLTFLDVDDSLNDFVFGSVLVFAVMATAISELRRQRVSPRERAGADRTASTDPGEPPTPDPSTDPSTSPSTSNVTSTESERP
jgi:ribose/xylose/arabinose/galactoside ABC-type transport system permease subunit